MIISLLTERQVEVLTLAVEEGYYETPRGTTHEKIATQIGVATTTVSEHLRKVEQRVFSALHEKIATQIGVATTTVSEHLRKVEQRVFSALIR
ncbi:helix-turn-helix domain-containing protein [Haloferax volcanii]